jgi:nucleoside phosphorylase
MFVCAGESESFDFAVPIGIGLVDVAINLTKICIENRPESITFIGSSGSYGRVEIFDIVKSRSAVNLENSYFLSGSYSPIDNSVIIDDIDYGVIVNSSNYITTNSKVSREYILNGIDIENMEFYSVLKVANMFNIPAEGIFIVTNYCDENAHKDFLENHKKAMELLIKYIEREL